MTAEGAAGRGAAPTWDPAGLADLAAELARAAFDPSVVVLAAPIDAEARDLFPAEAAHVARAVESRRREFATGRRLARAALARLGCAAVELPADAARAPVWPAGFTGSISHGAGACLVAVAPRTGFVVGVDVEGDEPLEVGSLEVVCAPGDLARVTSGAGCSDAALAKRLFSAKECAAKCAYAALGLRLELRDVAVALDAATGRFRASWPGREGAGGREATGALVRRGGLQLAGATLEV